MTARAALSLWRYRCTPSCTSLLLRESAGGIGGDLEADRLQVSIFSPDQRFCFACQVSAASPLHMQAHAMTASQGQRPWHHHPEWWTWQGKIKKLEAKFWPPGPAGPPPPASDPVTGVLAEAMISMYVLREVALKSCPHGPQALNPQTAFCRCRNKQ